MSLLRFRMVQAFSVVVISIFFVTQAEGKQPVQPVEVLVPVNPGPELLGRFGTALAVEGNRLIIGATGVDQGSCYYFELLGPSWFPRQTLIASQLPTTTSSSPEFGASIALSGDTFIAGAPRADNGAFVQAGRVLVYDLNPATGLWGFTTTLLPNDPGEDDEFGTCVALEGNIALVGAPRKSHSGFSNVGCVYVFTRSTATGQWAQTDQWFPQDPKDGVFFGSDLALSLPNALVGNSFTFSSLSPGNNNNFASPFVLQSGPSNTWQAEPTITSTGDASSVAATWFGHTVALDGDRALIGAPLETNTGGVGTAGAAYIFERGQTGQWQEQARLESLAPNRQLGRFSVDLEGDQAVLHGVQAFGEVFVFVRGLDGIWSEQFYERGQDYLSGAPLADVDLGYDAVIQGKFLFAGARYQSLPSGQSNPWFIQAGSVVVFDTDLDDDGVLNDCDLDFLGPGALDCNSNQVPDECDIRIGLSEDCNGNGVPDDCETAIDCNLNGVPDECEVASGVALDCNSNGLPDECDIDLGIEEDCNSNGILDVCEVADGMVADCNTNGIPDDCDVGNSSPDCNGNGVPDECDLLTPPVEVVFILDTSGSMGDEAAALCAEISGAVAELQQFGVSAIATLLGVTSAPGGDFSCLTSSVASEFGTFVPGAICCPTLGNSEDWGPAISIVSSLKPWTSDLRVIVPISDEGPRNGNPCNDPGDDRLAVEEATAVALANGVIVSPIVGTGGSPCVLALANEIAIATGGQAFLSTDPEADLAGALRDIVIAAVDSFDCNGNGVPDECDISAGLLVDCNGNAFADSCELDLGVAQDCDGNEVPDDCDAVFFVATSNPLSPLDGSSTQSFLVSAPPTAGTPVLLTVQAKSDLNALTERVEVFLNGVLVGDLFQSSGSDCPDEADVATLSIDEASFNAAASVGLVEFELVPTAEVTPAQCLESFATLRVEYQAVTATDCDANAVPDVCDLLLGAEDCNGNGVLDSCDIASGTSQDGNLDGVPDECAGPQLSFLVQDLGGFFDPATGVGSTSASLVVEEDPGSPNYPNPFDALTMRLRHDESLLTLNAVLPGLALQTLNGGGGAAFFAPELCSDYFSLGVVFSLGAPTEVLIATTPLDVVEVEYNTVPAVYVGQMGTVQSTLVWENGLACNGTINNNNVVVINNQSVGVVLTNGNISLDPGSAEALVRGDCNQDLMLDIADAVLTLGILFSGIPTSCQDSCDTNDDGMVNIADAINSLGILFSGDPLPSAPYPACGPDPTMDNLDCPNSGCP